MTEPTCVPLDEVADQIRSKNAGPFWQTLDVFFSSSEDFECVVTSDAISGRVIADLYGVDPESVKVFHLPFIRAIKVSFPRRITAGDFADRDLHAGQQHVLLAELPVPRRTSGSSPPGEAA